MEPYFQTLAVALVPQPREVPMPGYPAPALQRIFATVGESYSYESFEYVVGRRGAKFANDAADFVELRPAQHQVVARMDGADVLTAEMATSKAIRIFEAAAGQLEVPGFLQVNIEILAVSPIPDSDNDAKEYLDKRLTGDADTNALGDGYFASTVRYRRASQDAPGEDVFEVEPYFQDMSQVFLRHQIGRAAGDRPLEGFDQIENWITEAFSFLSGSAMSFLDQGRE